MPLWGRKREEKEPEPLSREEEYKKRREEVMSEEERRLAEKCLDWYRSSYRDKEQRGLFDKWEEIDLYWEGDVNLPESDTDPGSNTNIVHCNIEGQVALLVDQNIAIQTEGIGPSDEPFSEPARVMLEWCKERNRMRRKLDVHERRRKKFGTGVWRVLFDPDALDGFGLPVIEPRNIAYVFTDPAITDIYEAHKGRFVIEAQNKSVDWAKEQETFIPGRAEAIMPGYHPMESEWHFGEDEGETDEFSKDTYLHLYVFMPYKGKLRLIEMSGCGVILRDEKEFCSNPRLPYFFTPDAYREGTVHGKGTAELLINTQNLIDDIDDQIRINARLTGNPQKLVDTNSGIDIDKWTNEPNLNIPTNDINGAKYLTPPSMPEYIIRRRDFAITYESQRITRFSDQMTGQRQEGVNTATEALALQQAGAAGIDHSKALLEETLGEVFEYCLELMVENYDVEQAFRITETNDFLWFKASQLKEVPKLIPASDSYRQAFKERNPDKEPPKWMQLGNETKKAAFDIRITVGAGLPKNKAFIYKAIQEAYRDRAITTKEYRKLLKDYVSLPIDEELPPEMQPAATEPGAAANPVNALVEGLTGNERPVMPVAG